MQVEELSIPKFVRTLNAICDAFVHGVQKVLGLHAGDPELLASVANHVLDAVDALICVLEDHTGRLSPPTSPNASDMEEENEDGS